MALARYPGPRQSSRSVALAKRIAALGTRMVLRLNACNFVCVASTFEPDLLIIIVANNG